MSTERATFVLELRDVISAPAQDAVAELARLKESMTAGVARLREMQAAMQRLRAGGVDPSNESFRRLRAEIEAQKGANAALQQGILSLGGSFGRTEQGAQAASGGLGKLLTSMKSLGGPLGQAGERLERFVKGVSGAPMLVGGLAAAVVVTGLALAFITLARAAVQATIELAQYAVASADARRTEMLRIEGLLTLREYQRGAAGSAGELMSAIDRVASASATGRDDVTRYAQELYRAGLRGSELSSALEAVAITSSVQGDESARAFLRTARAAMAAGQSVRGLSDDVRRRLGGIARRQALSFDVQVRHLREDLTHLFDGLRLDGFLRGMREVTALFSQNNAFGRALASILRVMFQPFLDGAGRAGPVMRSFLEGLMIGVLDIAIGVLTVRNALLATFGKPTFSEVEMMRMAFLGGAVAAGLFAISLIPLVALLALIGAGIALAVAPFVILARALFDADATLQRAGLTWRDSGRLLVDGLIEGLTSRVTAMREAVAGVAMSASDALRDALQIQSPSRVFAELGRELPAGLAVGIEEGSGAASEAAGRMVEGAGAQTAGVRSAPTIGELHIHVDGGGDDHETARSIYDELVAILGGAGAEIGAAS